MKYFIPFIALLFILPTSCKKPEANFKLNKNEYAAGEMIDYTNFVQDNKNYKWEIFSAENPTIEVAGKNPVLKTDLMFQDGLCTLRLTTYNFSENKKVTQEEYFLTKTNRGSLRINNSNNSAPYIQKYDVYVDNQYIGKASYYSFFAKIPIGLRLITLKSPNKTLNLTLSIEKNQEHYITFVQ
jgi:hypothetical protein